MRVAAVVVTYNRADLLRECINALKNQTYTDFDIFIIDNNSTDNTLSVVNEFKLSNLIYFNTGRNIGGAGGFAFGMNKALVREYDYIWLMDDDTVAYPDTLQSLINKAIALKSDFSFISSVSEWTDGTLCLMNRQNINNGLDDIHALKNHLLRVPYASFVSCFLNADVCNSAGLPYVEFFIYGDDLEYTKRVSQYAPGYLDIDSYVIHKMNKNAVASVVVCEKERIDRYVYGVRNNTFIARKYKYLRKNIITNIKEIVKVILRSKDKKFKRISVIIKGFFKGLFFNPECIKEYSENLFDTKE